MQLGGPAGTKKFGENMSDGEAPKETFWSGRRFAPWLRGGPVQRCWGYQNDKQR